MFVRSRGAQLVQETVEFNSWFSKQGTIDVDNWKSIGINANKFHESGDKIPVNYFASWSTITYCFDSLKRIIEKKKEKTPWDTSWQAWNDGLSGLQDFRLPCGH